MTRPFSTSPTDSTRSFTPRSRSEITPSAESSERLRRWAALVAVGDAPLPEELTPAELKIVLTEVARLRRERLIRLVARAIAHDLHGNREP
ncbi:MAG: hypothetical protein JNL96_01790 [Planctomycetaceae bacterium]|nr:hypothetical protein [Planctomycetaceae bacterium]